MFSDPAKLIPFGVMVLAGVGLVMGWTYEHVVGLLIIGGAVHPLISAVNNVNPPKQ